jgi:hypothetical protein
VRQHEWADTSENTSAPSATTDDIKVHRVAILVPRHRESAEALGSNTPTSLPGRQRLGRHASVRLSGIPGRSKIHILKEGLAGYMAKGRVYHKGKSKGTRYNSTSTQDRANEHRQRPLHWFCCTLVTSKGRGYADNKQN